MRELADESVHCVITSPPYFGLRRYKGLPDSIWGGNEECGHRWGLPQTGITKVAKQGMTETIKYNIAVPDSKPPASNTCLLCGAWKGQLGNEPTIELYIQHLLEIFREVKRTLRKDGVCFVNISDSYNGSGHKDTQINSPKQMTNLGATEQRGTNVLGIKPSDLCLIPERFVLAMQTEGWYVRQRIIWHKPSCMPQSVKSRPTTDYEFIYMLTKSQSSKYYWDAEAVRERAESWGTRNRSNMRNGTDDPLLKHHGLESDTNPNGRNLRSVWSINPEAKPKWLSGHYATFPLELPMRCIKAATSEYGCCAECGKPWERLVEIDDPNNRLGKGYHDHKDDSFRGQRGVFPAEGRPVTKTLGWRKACKCNTEERVPCVVLDPFCGTGTTLEAAARLGRKSIGYELSETYCKLSVKRNSQGIMGG